MGFVSGRVVSDVAQMMPFICRTGQQWQQGFLSFVTMIQMTVEPNLVAYNVTGGEDSFGFLSLVFGAGFLLVFGGWENAQIWEGSRGM